MLIDILLQDQISLIYLCNPVIAEYTELGSYNI